MYVGDLLVEIQNAISEIMEYEVSTWHRIFAAVEYAWILEDTILAAVFLSLSKLF